MDRASPARCEAKREPFAAELRVDAHSGDAVTRSWPRIDLREGKPVRLPRTSTTNAFCRLLAVTPGSSQPSLYLQLVGQPRIRRVIFPFIGRWASRSHFTSSRSFRNTCTCFGL